MEQKLPRGLLIGAMADGKPVDPADEAPLELEPSDEVKAAQEKMKAEIMAEMGIKEEPKAKKARVEGLDRIVRERGALVACGGLSVDPYLSTEDSANPIGRVRHLYVRPSDRGRGIGRSLLEHILAAGTRHFPIIRLRTTPDAARLYERFGFRSVSDDTATHILVTPGPAPGAGG